MHLTNTERKKIAGAVSPTAIIALVAGAFVALFFGLSIGTSDWQNAYIAGVALIGLPAFVWIGDRYWLLMPFAMGATLPAVPIFAGRSLNLGELAVIVCSAAFALRFPFVQTRLVIYRWWFIGVFGLVLWTVLAFFVNPVGFAILGGSTFGGRKYLTIFMGFACFVILCQQSVREKDTKTILILWGIGAVLTTGWTVFQKAFLYSSAYGDGYYTWQQELRHLPTFLLALIFVRCSISEMVTRVRIVLIFMTIVCGAVMLYSGKREASFAFIFIPFIASIIHRDHKAIILSTLFGGVLLSTLVMGHGNLFELPKIAQRSIAYLPGDWDADVIGLQEDDYFRDSLNDLAIQEIKRHPFVGEGFALTMKDALDSIYTRGGQDRVVGISWHNLWLGTAADLGIPAMIFYMLAYLIMIKMSMSLIKRVEPGSCIHTLVSIILIYTLIRIIFAHVQSDVAFNFWTLSWQFGIIAAIKFTLDEQPAVPPTEAEIIPPAGGFPRMSQPAS